MAIAAVASGAPPADQPALVPGGIDAAASAAPALTAPGARKAEALALYFEGVGFTLDRDPARAIERFLKVIERDPGNVRLAKRLADTYVSSGRHDEALSILEETLRRNPASPDAYIHLSEFCVRHHNNSEPLKSRAFTTARSAIEKFPANPQVYGNLIALHLLEGEHDEAAAVIDRAAARGERDARFWLALGGSAAQVWPLREEANRDKVFSFFRKALDLAPDDPVIIESVADFLAQSGNVNEAVPLYERFVARRPDDLKAREKLAHGLAVLNRKDEAVAAWRKLLDISPQNPSVHEALARFHAAQGDQRKAIEHRAAALKFSGNENLPAALALVREMLDAGMPRESIDVLERAEFAEPDAPEPPYLAALAHGRLGEHDKAMAAFERTVHAAEADREMAAAFLNEGFHFQWGMACGRAGKIDDAAVKFRKAIELVPAGNPELSAKSYNALGYLWLEHDTHLDEAGQLIERALKFEPDNPAYLDSMGWFHFKKGGFETALDWLRRAETASKEPDAENLEHIARALHALGKIDEARAQLEKAVSLPEATVAMRERLKEWQAKR